MGRRTAIPDDSLTVDLIRAFMASGKTLRQLAEIYGCSRCTADKYLIKHGIPAHYTMNKRGVHYDDGLCEQTC